MAIYRFFLILAMMSGLTLVIAKGGLTEVATPIVFPAWADKAPVIDGKLTEALWEKCQPQPAFKAAARRPAKAGTVARVAYDAKALYIAFECKAPGASLEVEHKEDSRPVWVDESVELYISPWDAPDKEGLYQFVVNAGGYKTFLRNQEVEKNSNWQARTGRTASGWSVEIRIPFSVFNKQGQNEAAWRILFCRNSKEFDEPSSFPAFDERFANFWAYARLKPQQGKPSFLTTRALLKPVTSKAAPLGVIPLKPAKLDESETPLILPEPAAIKFTKSRFVLKPETRIVIGERATHLDSRAAEVMADWIKEKCGFRPIIERSGTYPNPSAANAKGKIVIGETKLNPLAAAALKKSGDTVSISNPGPEGYVVRVTSDWAAVVGSDMLGTFWGAQTLAQMIQSDGEGHWWLAGGIIRDKPAMKFRSVHLLTARDTLEFQSKLIKEILSPFKINYVILQMDKFNWESHPEVTDKSNCVSADDLRKLIALGKDYHITYIPLVMSLGHMEWIFHNGANLDIAEDIKHPYAYCPLNEKSYKLMEDLFDEAYEVFGRPSYFHIGHDEFDMEGDFPIHPECKRLGKVELYYRDTLRLTSYLKEKGTRVIMWGDILQKPDFKDRLDDLPKDIIIADWRYSPIQTYPSVNMFQKHGFEVVGCTWYDPANIYFFSKYAQSRKALGMMQTTWSGWEPADVVFKKWPEQMFQYVLGAAWAWSPGRPPLDAMTFDADVVFNQRWWKDSLTSPTARVEAGELFAIDLAPWANVCAKDSRETPAWLGLGEGNDLSKLRSGVRKLGNLTFQILSPANGKPSAIMLRGPEVTTEFPEAVNGITVGSKAKQLWFLHTTAFSDGPERSVGKYVIHYNDGTKETTSLVYGANIMAWRDNRPTLAYQAAWRGNAADGRVIRLRMFPWTNPHQDKVIASIDFVGQPGSQSSPVLLAITGIR